MSTWGSWTDHWKSQVERHKAAYEAGAVAAVAVGVPVVGTALAGAYLAVKAANENQKKIDDLRAATKELAQVPLLATASVQESLGASGEIQVSKNISQWIPIGMIFIIIMYLIFKD